MRSILFNCAAALFLLAGASFDASATGIAERTNALFHSASGIDYTFHTVDVPRGIQTSAIAINDLGHIAGTFTHPQRPGQFSQNHGFLLKNGSFATIEFPHESNEFPDIAESVLGINNVDQLVGTYRLGHGFNYGFLVDHGFFNTISSPEFEVIDARAINDSGTIVGNFFSSSQPGQHAYRLKQQSFATIDVPGSSSTTVLGMNNAEDIVGEYFDTDRQRHGFLSQGGRVTTIERPGTLATVPYGINSGGAIVGTTNHEGGETHGFLLINGKFQTIDFPGATSTEAFGINSLGLIVGDYRDSAGTMHGFVAVPNFLGRLEDFLGHGKDDLSNGGWMNLPFMLRWWR